MQLITFFRSVLVIPITNILVFFYHFMALIHIPYALGFAIIFLTVSIRVILFPFMSQQIKAASKMQKLSPHLANIRKKHKDDKKRQQEEMMKLYKEHGVNPAAGCLPSLIQLPVIWSLYSVLGTTVAAHSFSSIQKINEILYFPFLKITEVWNTTFFGLPLYSSPAKLVSGMPFILLIPVLTGILQFILSKMMAPEEPVKTTGDDFQSAFQTQSVFIFPVMIGLFSYNFPIGISLYWNAFTIFGILQQYWLVGPGGLKPLVAQIKTYGKNR